ncbi:MAG: hypothetical protein R3F43_09745 [bacterium]
MAGIRLLALGALLAGCLPEPPAPGFWRTGADAAPGGTPSSVMTAALPASGRDLQRDRR